MPGKKAHNEINNNSQKDNLLHKTTLSIQASIYVTNTLIKHGTINEFL